MNTMKKDPTPLPVPAPKRGRPLSFNREEAVHKAMLLFWQHGYEATSLNDLTTALNVTPSSIYTAFGDKKRLFLEAVRCYVSGPVNAESIIQGAETAREAALGLLRTAAIGFTGESTPRGCLLASSAISCSDSAQDVKDTLADLRKAIETSLREKIKRGIKDGNLPTGTDASVLAAHTVAVIQGMSTLARDGATRASLLKVADIAMQCWPAAGEPKRRRFSANH